MLFNSSPEQATAPAETWFLLRLLQDTGKDDFNPSPRSRQVHAYKKKKIPHI